MIAGMLAAYRSTIETHLNWGTSYLVHDFYRRFWNRGASGAALRLRGPPRDGAPDGLRGPLDVRARDGEGELRPDPVGRRGDGAHLSAALVLVAHQRLERSRGDGELLPDRARRSSSPGETGHPSRAARRPARDRCGDDRRVARRHVSRRGRRTGRRSLSFYRLVRPAGAGLALDSRRDGARRLARLAAAEPARLGARMPLRVRRALRSGKHPLRENGAGRRCGSCSSFVSGLGLIRLLPRLWSGREA